MVNYTADSAQLSPLSIWRQTVDTLINPSWLLSTAQKEQFVEDASDVAREVLGPSYTQWSKIEGDLRSRLETRTGELLLPRDTLQQVHNVLISFGQHINRNESREARYRRLLSAASPRASLKPSATDEPSLGRGIAEWQADYLDVEAFEKLSSSTGKELWREYMLPLQHASKLSHQRGEECDMTHHGETLCPYFSHTTRKIVLDMDTVLRECDRSTYSDEIQSAVHQSLSHWLDPYGTLAQELGPIRVQLTCLAGRMLTKDERLWLTEIVHKMDLEKAIARLWNGDRG